MTKEELKALGLDEDQIKEVFRLNGIAVNNARGDLETKEKEVETLKGQLKTANKQIEDFKELDVETIKQTAEDYKESFEKLEKESKAEIEEIKYNHSLNEYLNNFNFSNDRIKNSILEDVKSKEFKFEDGKFVGADDYMKELQKNEPDSFAKEEPTKKTYTGFKPGDGTDKKDEPLDVGSQFAKQRNESSVVESSLWG